MRGQDGVCFVLNTYDEFLRSADDRQAVLTHDQDSGTAGQRFEASFDTCTNCVVAINAIKQHFFSPHCGHNSYKVIRRREKKNQSTF